MVGRVPLKKTVEIERVQKETITIAIGIQVKIEQLI